MQYFPGLVMYLKYFLYNNLYVKDNMVEVSPEKLIVVTKHEFVVANINKFIIKSRGIILLIKHNILM